MSNITGVYEHIITTMDIEKSLRYWKELGFNVINQGTVSQEMSKKLYGVNGEATSYRLKCADLDSHGLLRILDWADKTLISENQWSSNVLSPGNRWVTQRTDDIIALTYAYDDDKKRGGQWLISDLVRNYLGASGVGTDFYNRYKGVYEVLVHGLEAKQVFFQRVGYSIEGYGTITENPLLCSEFTHGGIVVRNLDHINFYVDVLGLIDEGKTLQGTPRKMGQDSGPFMNNIGEGYHAHTIVSPNQKAGRIYYAMPIQDYENLTDGAKQVMDVIKYAENTTNGIIDVIGKSKPGVRGLCSASYKAKNIQDLYSKVKQSTATYLTELCDNEFEEKSFTFVAPDGVHWTIVEWK
ncbi:MAG: hypothetical protein ATN31_03080 [Candidatus Epulonipiscioides saccharophilum]|nr:MAG: hypothetical protein ATN31_03080 [Epulopiscium sp. AS2M-Bin001]